MPKALSEDLAWRVVKKSWLDGKTHAEIVDALDVSHSGVKKLLRRFKIHGDVNEDAPGSPAG